MRISKFIFILIATTFSNLLLAQIAIDIAPHATTDITPCANNLFELTLTNPSGNIPANTVTVVPEFGPAVPILIAGGPSPLVVNFDLYLDCSSINDQNTQVILFGNDIIQNPYTGLDDLATPYVIDYPQLSLVAGAYVNQNFSSYVGETVTRSFTLNNVGNADFSGAMVITSNQNCDNAMLTGMSAIGANGAIPGIFTANANGQGGIFVISAADILDGSFITIEETLEVTDCINDCPQGVLRNEILVNWGCDLNNLCQQNTGAIDDILEIDFALDWAEINPEVSILRLLPDGMSDDFCFNEPALISQLDLITPDNNTTLIKHEYRFQNTGITNAYNIGFRLRSEGLYNTDILLEELVFIDSNSPNYNPNDLVQFPDGHDITLPNVPICMLDAQNAGYNVLQNIEFFYPLLEPGEYLDLVYYTFRCCPDLNNWDASQLHMNSWQIVTLTETSLNNPFTNDPNIGECGNPLQVNRNNNSILPYEAYNYNNMHDIEIAQTLYFPVTNMIGAIPGSAALCADVNTQIFQVTTDIFNQNSLGHEQFFTDANGVLQGELIIDITLDWGLGIDDLNTIELVSGNTIMSATNGLSITSIANSGANNTISGEDYTITIDLSFFADYQEFHDFMNGSVLMLPFTPCCVPGFYIESPVYLIEWGYNPDLTCGCVDPIQLSSQEDDVRLQCPGCVTPGIIVDGVTVERMNFGWADANDNGLADNIVDLSNPDYIPSANDQNPFFSMPGDNVRTTISSYGQEGDSNGGFTFSDYHTQNSQEPLDELYFLVKNTCGEMFDWNFDATNDPMIWINQPNTASIGPIALANALVEENPVSGTLLFRVNIADIGSTFVYEINQDYTFSYRQNICGNNGADFVELCEVEVKSWYSGDPSLTIATIPAQIVPAENDTLTGSAADRAAHFGESDVFLCETSGGIHRVFTIYNTFTSDWWQNNEGQAGLLTCTKRQIARYALYIGGPNYGDRTNLFRNEFRPLQYQTSQLEFETPTVYEINSVVPVIRHRSVIQQYEFPGLANFANEMAGNLNTNSINTFTTPFNGTEIDLGALNLVYANDVQHLTGLNGSELVMPAAVLDVQEVLIGDESIFHWIDIDFEPTEHCDDDIYALDPLNASISYEDNGFCMNDIQTGVTGNTGNDELSFPNPEIEIVTGAVQIVNSQTYCLDFEVRKTSINPTHVAENVFVYFELPPSGIEIQDIIDPSGNSEDAGEFIILGDLTDNNSFVMTVCIEVTECNLPINSLTLHHGYFCDENDIPLSYPIPLNAPCNFETSIIEFILPEPIFQAGDVTISSGTFQNCAPIDMTACTNSFNAGEIEFVNYTLSLPIEYTLVAGSVEVHYENNAGQQQAIFPTANPLSGTIVGSDIEYFFELPPGWTAMAGTDDICIFIEFRIIPGCDIVDFISPTIKVEGEPYCQDPNIFLEMTLEQGDLPVHDGSICTDLVLSLTPSPSSCTSATGSITSNITAGAAPYTFSWANANAPLISISSTQDLINAPPGNYELTVIDDNRCIWNYTETIVDDGSFIANVTQQSSDPCTGTVTLLATAGDGYQWYLDGNLLSETTQTIVVNQTGNYSVDVQSGFCIASANTNVISLPIPGIFTVIGINQSSVTLLSDLITNGNVLPMPAAANATQYLMINGILVLDEDYAFASGSLVHFGPGGGIDIQPGIDLNAFNTTFINNPNCQTMWRGIVVDMRASLTLNKCTIDNAHYGVHCQNYSALMARNSWFGNNFVSILLTNDDLTNHKDNVLTMFDISDCTFLGRPNGLLSPYPGQIQNTIPNIMAEPAQTRKPYAGILGWNNTGITITKGDNVFINLTNGILLLNSTSSVRNYSFKQAHFEMINRNTNLGMTEYPASPYSYFGIHFDGFGGTMNFILSSENTFLNVNRSQLVTRSETDIQGSIIGGPESETGIEVAQCSDYGIFIQHNNIEASSFGIKTTNNDNVTMSIYKNDVFVNTSGTFPNNVMFQAISGIYSSGNSISSLPLSIEENTVEIGFGKAAIYLNNTVGAEVLRNEIELIPLNNEPRCQFGIEMAGGHHNIVATNSIEYMNNGVAPAYQGGLFTDEFAPGAIDVTSSPSSVLECNITSNTRTGIRISGNMLNSAIKGNTFGDHFNGLRYTNMTFYPGGQVRTGNVWDGTYQTATDGMGPGAAVDNSYIPGSLPQLGSEYFVNGSSGSPNNFFPPYAQIYPSNLNTNLQVDWFIIDNTGSNFDCMQSQYKSIVNSSFDINMAQSVAKGTVNVPLFSEPLREQAKRVLYNAIEEDSSLIGITSDIDSFYIESTSSSLKEFHDAEESKKEISEVGENEKMELLSINSDLQLIDDNLFILDSVHISDTLIIDTLLAQRQELVENKVVLLDSSKITSDSLKIIRHAQVDEAFYSYQDIIDQELIEYNERTVELIFLIKIAKNNPLDSTEVDDLLFIANQCPVLGGSGVYKARSILEKVGDFVYFDREICLTQGINIKRAVNAEKITVMYYPNPVDDAIHVMLDLDFVGRIEVIDIAGKILMDEQIENRSNTINIKALETGIYFFRLLNSESQVIDVSKIIKE